MPNLRVGSVPYLVGRPLDLGLGEEQGIELVHDVPANLVPMLRSGEIDVAMVSSIELFRQPGYRFIPGIGVFGQGLVSSVQVFLRKPLSEVQSIAMDPASRTAACLVRVLLADRPNGAPEFIEVPMGENPRDLDADGWLRIGDEALRESLAPDCPKVFNPSKAWAQKTGLPFVFAPWIVAPDAQIEPHLAAFARARLRGASAIAELSEQAAKSWNLPLPACTRYLAEECQYELGDEMTAALYAFRDAAGALGLCDPSLEPKAVEAFLAHLG
ncbi:MAG: chorismate dehydratase [Candidatus Paceibacteria bacterium]|jgi:chorismate dehydratase